MNRDLMRACLAAVSVAASAHAANVLVSNGGFEMPLLGTGGVFVGLPPGWASVTPSEVFGVWNPQGWGTYALGTYVGTQIGFLNSGVLEKRVPAVIKGPSTWTLRWQVGRRAGFDGGLTVTIFAGNTQLGQWMDTPATLPAAGTFAERSIGFVVSAGSPAIGLPVRFTLDKTSGAQANFDDFRLESSDPGPPCPADLNSDDLVNDDDFTLFVERYNELLAEPDGMGDLNFDALVDDVDFQLFIVQYNILECPE